MLESVECGAHPAPHLRTTAAFDGATDMYRDWMCPGGIAAQGFLQLVAVRVRAAAAAGEGHALVEHDRDRVIYDMYCHPFDDVLETAALAVLGTGRHRHPVLSVGTRGKASLHLRGTYMGFEPVSGPRQLPIADAPNFQATQMLYSQPDFRRAEPFR